MSPLPSKHPFDEWFERVVLRLRNASTALAAWNAVIGAAMTTAVHIATPLLLPANMRTVQWHAISQR